jgi:hypothetical protein
MEAKGLMFRSLRFLLGTVPAYKKLCRTEAFVGKHF